MQHNEFEGQAGAPGADAGTGTTAPGAAPDAGSDGAAGDSLEVRLAAAEAKSAEHYDLYVRAVADMAKEDVSKAHKYAIESFAESLLPVRDSLELALKAENVTVESMREGVDATLRLLASVFDKNKLIVIDPAGQKFDPNLHQAISMVPGSAANPPVAANHVVAVLQKGYLINDRVLRPALVTVAQA